jgi:hypothetical protein
MLAESCGESNWLKPSGSQVFTISSRNQNKIIWYVTSTGNIGVRSVTDSRTVRPVLYLNSNVKIADGDGKDKPFILK